MWNRNRNEHSASELNRALSRPAPRAIRLLAELTEAGSGARRPLLMTAPAGDGPAALAAGDLAAAALDMGLNDLRLMDLRRGGNRFKPDAMVRPLDVYYPAPGLVADVPRFQDWMRELTGTTSLAIILCGGVLDPRHWSEDPVAWTQLKPRVILAAAEGRHTENQVAEAADRLRRNELEITGGILVTDRTERPGAPGWVNQLAELRPSRPALMRKGTA
jgi:hypothetical protein